jgi:hypothetical protein
VQKNFFSVHIEADNCGYVAPLRYYVHPLAKQQMYVACHVLHAACINCPPFWRECGIACGEQRCAS